MSDSDEVVKKRKRKRGGSLGSVSFEAPKGERMGAKRALARIEAIKAQGSDTGEDDTSDETMATGDVGSSEDSSDSASMSENTPLVKPGSVREESWQELELELDKKSLEEYRKEMKALTVWRENAARELSAWKEEQEEVRLQRLLTSDITGWQMPESGQPLPIKISSTSKSKAVKAKTNTFSSAHQRWLQHVAANPDMQDELRAHRDSTAAFLPRQELLSKTREARLAKETAEYASHVEQQKRAEAAPR